MRLICYKFRSDRFILKTAQNNPVDIIRTTAYLSTRARDFASLSPIWTTQHKPLHTMFYNA